MGGGKGKAPKAPKIDYEAQSRINREAFMAQNPNMVGPFGSVTYTGTPGEEGFTKTTSLAPEQQAMWEARMGAAQDLSGQLRDQMSTPMDWEQFGPADYTQQRQAAEDAAYGRLTSRLDPRFQQQEQAMEVKLRNQGLRPGDEAYDAAMGNLMRSKEDAYSSAMQDAVGAGRQEAQLASGMRQQQIQNALQQRGWNLNEIKSLMAGAGTPGGDAMRGSMAPMDMSQQAQMNYQADLNRYNAQQAGMQGLMSAGATLGGAAIIASDARLKDNIEFAANINGVNYYTWDWKEYRDEPTFGVIAQELAKTHPHLVVQGDDGYLRVNYGGLH